MSGILATGGQALSQVAGYLSHAFGATVG